MRNYAARGKRDAIEPDVIDALQANGWTVLRVSVLDGPDLVIAKGWQGTPGASAEPRTATVEVKSTRTAKLRPGQQAFADRWPGEHYILRSVDEALKIR